MAVTTLTPRREEDAPDERRLDGRVTQLLNDVRNTLLGVQVLLAGLVAVPFSARFAELPRGDRRLYLTAVLAAVVSSALLVAPGQYHRLCWKHEARPETLVVGRRLATGGSISLAAAVVALVALLTRAVERDLATPVAIATAVLIASLWYVVPFAGRARTPPETGAAGQ